MLENKRILIALMLLLAILLVPSMVSASNEEPTVRTEVYGSNKSIKVVLEDISLEDSVNEYKFGISKAKATEPTEWLDLQEIEASTCTAIITPENETHRSILRSGNKCYLFIKDITNETVEIITQVDLSLPLESALNIIPNTREGFEISYLYRNGNDLGNYNITSIKIDDVEVIKKYLEAKNNNQNTLDAVKNMLSTEIPNNTWKRMEQFITDEYAWINYSGLTEYEGLYMIWGQVSYSEGRSIYGYVLYDNYPDGYVLPEEDNTDIPSTPTTQPDNNTSKEDNTPTTQPDDNKKTFNNHTYKIIDKLMTWQEAKEYCESLGGYLVTITSAEEQEFIASFVKEKGFTQNRFWMGATDKDKEGTWKWITEEKFSYSNWGNTQPNNGESGGQNFGVYVAYDATYNGIKLLAEQWDDINGDSEEDIYFICEWGEVEKETTTNKPTTTNKDTTKDTTTAKDNLPNTGRVLLMWIIGIVAVSVTVAYIRYKKIYM